MKNLLFVLFAFALGLCVSLTVCEGSHETKKPFKVSYSKEFAKSVSSVVIDLAVTHEDRYSPNYGSWNKDICTETFYCLPERGIVYVDNYRSGLWLNNKSLQETFLRVVKV